MVHSMTGFAAASRTLSHCVLSVELRAVNSRYLDISFRLPEELRSIESQLRELLMSRAQRGKLECRVGIADLPAAQRTLELNADLVQRLVTAARDVQQIAAEAAALNVVDILRWPGVIGDTGLSMEEVSGACLALVDEAAAEFNASRAREGANLARVILDRAERMRALIEQVAPRIPQIVDSYRQKLSARLTDAGMNPDDDRMRQEIVLFASRIDVDEEISRLRAHLKELEHVIASGGAVGRRLDFLMQELNREANTLGSKSADLACTQAAVELKVLIEQMREQVQNIE
jgi:uncharacterized protein (TIGR00255 family)